jgi:hypothetical protein
MIAEPVMNNAPCKAFITALLLTGSLERAETAVLEGVRFSDLEETAGKSLLQGAVEASIPSHSEIPEQRTEELDKASSILPFELQRVLRLSTDLRHCFVLRVLLGLPREVCARMLRLDIRQIAERTSAAMQELAILQASLAVSV